MSDRFLALDLAGSLHNIALCEESVGVAAGSAGWLVRSRIERVHTWAAPGGRDARDVRQEIVAAAARWQFNPADMSLVLVTAAGRSDILELARSIDECRRIWLPRDGQVVSPRGIAQAVSVKDYCERMSSPAGLDVRAIRDVFVSMMEKAADAVQADGFEQDDSFLDRYAEVRFPREQRSLILPVEALTDEVWLLEQWHRAYAEWWGGRPVSQEVEILSLRLRCAVGTPDHGFRAASMSESSTPPLEPPAGWELHPCATGHVLLRVKHS